MTQTLSELLCTAESLGAAVAILIEKYPHLSIDSIVAAGGVEAVQVADALQSPGAPV